MPKLSKKHKDMTAKKILDRLSAIPMHTAEEDATITNAAQSDQAAALLTDDHFAAMKRGRGRPRLQKPKVKVTMRLDAEFMEFVKTLPLWQTKVNQILVEALKAGEFNSLKGN